MDKIYHLKGSTKTQWFLQTLRTFLDIASHLWPWATYSIANKNVFYEQHHCQAYFVQVTCFCSYHEPLHQEQAWKYYLKGKRNLPPFLGLILNTINGIQISMRKGIFSHSEHISSLHCKFYRNLAFQGLFLFCSTLFSLPSCGALYSLGFFYFAYN